MNLPSAAIAVALLFCLLAVPGCQGMKGYQQGAPSPVTPAPELRAKHQYRYYPDSAVYMDTARKTFFYRNKRRTRSLHSPLPFTVKEHHSASGLFRPSRSLPQRRHFPPRNFSPEVSTTLEASVVLYLFSKGVNRLLTEISHFFNLTAPRSGD